MAQIIQLPRKQSGFSKLMGGLGSILPGPFGKIAGAVGNATNNSRQGGVQNTGTGEAFTPSDVQYGMNKDDSSPLDLALMEAMSSKAPERVSNPFVAATSGQNGYGYTPQAANDSGWEEVAKAVASAPAKDTNWNPVGAQTPQFNPNAPGSGSNGNMNIGNVMPSLLSLIFGGMSR